jgi:hypothetical protein
VKECRWCEDVALKKTKLWLAVYKCDILPLFGYDVRILLPSQPPIASSIKFNTIKKLMLVLPGDLTEDIIYISLRQLNPTFGLWLDKLTLHFKNTGEDGFMDSWITVNAFRRMKFNIKRGLTQPTIRRIGRKK